MVTFLGYYGHTLHTGVLYPENVYLSYSLGALAELPSWAVPLLISRAGRRWPLLLLLLSSALASLVLALVPWAPARLPLGLVAKLAVTGAYYICQQYCSEILPTVVRGQGVGTGGGIYLLYIIPLYQEVLCTTV